MSACFQFAAVVYVAQRQRWQGANTLYAVTNSLCDTSRFLMQHLQNPILHPRSRSPRERALIPTVCAPNTSSRTDSSLSLLWILHHDRSDCHCGMRRHSSQEHEGHEWPSHNLDLRPWHGVVSAVSAVSCGADEVSWDEVSWQADRFHSGPIFEKQELPC